MSNFKNKQLVIKTGNGYPGFAKYMIVEQVYEQDQTIAVKNLDGTGGARLMMSEFTPMPIYTSYFAKYAALNEARLLPVSIARWQPKWLIHMPDWLQFSDVAPSNDILTGIKDGSVSETDYANDYMVQLKNYGANEIIDVLATCFTLDKYKGRFDGIALCCYEAPGKFCHRHLLSYFLTDQLGIEVIEWQK